ncbi:hypothetical protein [Paenibacillus elgii]|uniref:hypothetical protein n=1 Tax=Paenibacillus elgii TaxID=189691 RepID=UPI0020425E0F|nr:hypothetical protein [Paenibacillus elgii]MCM3273066.1 hypothetical protein [Paenibacillus elgii]
MVTEIMIENASQSKAAFINFIIETGQVKVKPWLIGWLEEYWTNEMSSAFFEVFWNGSIDEDVLDDIEACMVALDPRKVVEAA